MSPFICDSTLREGEQAAGVSFTVLEKVAIAKALSEAGVDEIEAGIPSAGILESDAVSRIASLDMAATVVGWCRAAKMDIDAAANTGVNRVHICIPVSDGLLETKFGQGRQWAQSRLRSSIEYARSLNLEVSVGFEDTSRAEDDFVIELAQSLLDLGIVRFRFSDSVGILEPFTTFRRCKRLVLEVPIPWEIHSHDDMGLATANTLAALKAGFSWANVTVLGMGDRSGVGALEEVVVAASTLYKEEFNMESSRLSDLAALVSGAAGRPIPMGKSIVGDGAFSHEAGIHVAAVVRNPSSYEPFDPLQVGARRRIVLGKHSGRAALRYVLGLACVEVSEPELVTLLEEVRTQASVMKSVVTVDEAVSLLEEIRARASAQGHLKKKQYEKGA